MINTDIDTFKESFSLHDPGKIKNYVGLEVTEIPGEYKVSQRSRVAQLRRKYNTEQCKGAKRPTTLEFEKDGSDNPVLIQKFLSLCEERFVFTVNPILLQALFHPKKGG